MVTAIDTVNDPTNIPDIALDPFELEPHLHSVITGLHGDDPTDPTYAFHTRYVDNLRGLVTMELTFTNLRSRRDRLVLNVHALDRSINRLDVILTTEISLRTVAASGGHVSVSFDAVSGHSYALLGRTNLQPQASASDLAILCRQRLRTDDHTLAPASSDCGFHPDEMRTVAAMASLYPPLLGHPGSQARTGSQFREPVFRDWLAKADFSKTSTDAQWECIYLLQVLNVFGVLDTQTRGLSFGPERFDVMQMLGNSGCAIAFVPGRSRLGSDDKSGEINNGYFSRIGLPGADQLGSYSFLWSTGLCDLLASTEDIIHLVEDSIEYLKPGGLAVHMLMADLRPDETGLALDATFTRNTLGQLSLALVGCGNEVAQLNLYADCYDGIPVPYGVIIRKG
jgi:hypothetical protein